MYSVFRELCEKLLRIPAAPEPPPGDATQTKIFRAAPNYYRYLLALWALKTAAFFFFMSLFCIGPVIAALSLKSRSDHPWEFLIVALGGGVLLLGVIGSLFALALVKLDFEKRWYVVTDRSLRVREGILKMREATVTFANIQNISISQGPLQRVLGIADLRVDTAGGGGGGNPQHGQPGTNLHTTWFRGVDNANEIRELMQRHLLRLKDSGLGDHDEQSKFAAAFGSLNILSALREVSAEASALRQAALRSRSAN